MFADNQHLYDLRGRSISADRRPALTTTRPRSNSTTGASSAAWGGTCDTEPFRPLGSKVMDGTRLVRTQSGSLTRSGPSLACRSSSPRRLWFFRTVRWVTWLAVRVELAEPRSDEVPPGPRCECERSLRASTVCGRPGRRRGLRQCGECAPGRPKAEPLHVVRLPADRRPGPKSDCATLRHLGHARGPGLPRAPRPGAPARGVCTHLDQSARDGRCHRPRPGRRPEAPVFDDVVRPDGT